MSEPAETANQVDTKGIVVGLVGIYIAGIAAPAGMPYLAFLAGIGAIFATKMGADAVRRVCSYGIGTGVPSIGMLALGMGIISAMFGLAFGYMVHAVFIGPIVGLVLALVIGFVVGSLANKIIKLNIPVMERCLTEIAGAGVLVLTGLSVMIAGSLDFAVITEKVITTGYIAPVFILGALGILHPFNASLGPDETQDRTLTHAYSCGAIAMVIGGVCSIAVSDPIAGIISTVIGLAIWYVTFVGFVKLVKRDAGAGYVGTGLLPPGAM
uniref:Tetrahydromethanopterin S-methyltransferase subunit C n=1 Tax=Candidatus Methanogaster sp. ANME-2c ERB4 TaxID=2759911 RepID=A0A7G9YH16_9EURY|nr:tetrahydromethanopterin S-methyltransferase subunit C [Methanosarcinales archaeon ANME-2c ERB4]